MTAIHIWFGAFLGLTVAAIMSRIGPAPAGSIIAGIIMTIILGTMIAVMP